MIYDRVGFRAIFPVNLRGIVCLRAAQVGYFTTGALRTERSTTSAKMHLLTDVMAFLPALIVIGAVSRQSKSIASLVQLGSIFTRTRTNVDGVSCFKFPGQGFLLAVVMSCAPGRHVGACSIGS